MTFLNKRRQEQISTTPHRTIYDILKAAQAVIVALMCNLLAVMCRLIYEINLNDYENITYGKKR